MECLDEALMHRDEAALVDVIGDWEEFALLELLQGSLVPFVLVVFAPARHVEVAADDIDSVVGAEIGCCLDGLAELQAASQGLFGKDVVEVDAQHAQ